VKAAGKIVFVPLQICQPREQLRWVISVRVIGIPSNFANSMEMNPPEATQRFMNRFSNNKKRLYYLSFFSIGKSFID
jgi:hypothetical protein